jgi:colanic acid/amylovoran biosynthesis glycosyltransferase
MSQGDAEVRIGYVLKMYPRFSETFIVNELLAMQDLGTDLEVFSLRPPVDGRFHSALADVRAVVTYVPTFGRPADAWEALRHGRVVLGDAFDDQLPDLLVAPSFVACQAVHVASLAVERRVTHLHAHFGSLAASVARLAAALAGITYSVTLHAKDIYHQDVDHAALATTIADAAAVVTVSDYNEQYLRGEYAGRLGRLTRVYNGLDLGTIVPARPDDRPPTVIGVGRLVEKKGFAHLVDAVGLLVAQGRKVQLELVGAGAEEPALRARVAERGIEQNVTFCGPLTQAETHERVRCAAVLAAPCVVGEDGNRDGLPTVILESLALGTPVVATPVTGIPEAVLDGRTGILVAEGDVVELAEALARLLDDPALRCSLALEGRRHVEEHFDIRRNARQLHDLLVSSSRNPDPVPA